MQRRISPHTLCAMKWSFGALIVSSLAISAVALTANAPEIKNAVWRAGAEKLVIKGKAAPRNSIVAVSDAESGDVLGTAVVNRRNQWRLVLRDPAIVPCAVTAKTNQTTAVKRVKKAPSDCGSSAVPSVPRVAEIGASAALPELSITGREWIVRKGDTGDGSEAFPLGSIQAALDAAQAGDGISILPGNYNEALNTRRNGTAANPIVIQAKEGRGTVTITNNGRVLTVNHAHHQFSQLVLAGQYGQSDLIKVKTAANGWMLYNSEVKETSRDCIDMDSPSNVVISESTIHHCLNAADGRTDAHGIAGASVRGLLIQNTKVHSFSGDAFQIDSGRTSPGWNNVVIEGSEFWLAPLPKAANGFSAGVVPGENAIDTKVRAGYRPKMTIRNSSFWGYQNGLIANMAALNLKESVDVIVDAVTIYDTDIAFRLRYPARVQITNAIVHSTNRAVRYEDNIAQVSIWHSTFGKGIHTFFQEASSEATTFDVQNSIFLSTSFPAEVNTARNLVVGDGSFNGVDVRDYHLDTFSPAVDSATPLGIGTDRFGTKRPLGNGYDMGAVESR